MTVLVVVLTAIALGLSAASLVFALSARRVAREAHAAARALAVDAARRRRDEREQNLGAPPETGERRREDLGSAARHRAPDDERARRRDVDDPQYRIEDATAAIPVVRPDEEELPATAEHPAPTGMYRRPPPPLPRPGSIGRPR